MITITIPGDPIPKLRPRFTKQGITYDKQHLQKSAIKLTIRRILQDRFKEIAFPISGRVNCEFYFYMPIPESLSKKDKTLILWNAFEHISKPDCDNLAKFYLDCMSGIVYEDDRKIYRLSILKRYDEEPRTEIRIMPPQKPIMEKVKAILSLFSAEELADFADDLMVIADCLDTEFLNQREEMTEQLQLEAAYAISIFADKHAAGLMQIAKKYPGVWKNISEYERTNYKEILNPDINGICYSPTRWSKQDEYQQ